MMGLLSVMSFILILPSFYSATPEETSAVSAANGPIVIRVASRGDDFQCEDEEKKIPCKSLEKANAILKNYTSDVTIEVLSNVTLHSEFTVTDSYNINITGNSTNVSLPNSSLRMISIECATAKSAGFTINNVQNFSFNNLAIINCTARRDPKEHFFNSAMFIQSSSNILLENAHFQNCTSTAVVLYNNKNYVMLRDSSFVHNHKVSIQRNDPSNISHSGALSILHNSSNSGPSCIVIIMNCIFHYNQAPYTNKVIESYGSSSAKETSFRDRGYGGAIFIEIGGYTSGNSIIIHHSNFTCNTANRGGAVYAYIENNAQNNNIYFNNSIFFNNTADISGGGLNVGYFNNQNISSMNAIVITECKFISNTASSGAGLTFYSAYNAQKLASSLVVTNSTWSGNTGVLSSAVDLAPLYYTVGSYLPEPKFINCSFFNNSLHHTINSDKKTAYIFAGNFVVTKFKVYFQEHTNFSLNKYSALVIVSGIAEFCSGSNVLFHNNIGYNGGAIAMYGFSTLLLNNNSFHNFSNNLAFINGGAIYYQTNDQHNFLEGDNHCFLRNTNVSLTKTIKVNFEGNRANLNNASIYSETFDGCYHSCLKFNLTKYDSKIDNILKCIGNFTFNKGPLLISSPKTFQFNFNSTHSYKVIPGDKFQIQADILDEFNNTIQPFITISKFNHSAKVDIRKSTLNLKPNNCKADVYPVGTENATSKFIFIVLGTRPLYFTFEVTLLPCPPGFILNNRSCTCAEGKDEYKYITKCSNKFKAKLKTVVWVGYIPESSLDYRDLYFAPCAFTMCNVTNDNLPEHGRDLNNKICNENREGVLCGKCKSDHSTYYHSWEFKCERNHYCHLGIVLYVLSEILPMVIFFLVIITFDLSFISGKYAAFIFFTQYFNQPEIQYGPLFYLHIPYRIFYGLFNLEYFNIEQLSFCLWADANALDTIAFKYVTILVGLGLVLTIIALLHNNQCNRLCRLRRKVSTKKSVVNGLCTFLVICYAQCTKTSFHILKHSVPIGYNGKHEKHYSYYGGLPFFSTQHLPYAVPALISLVFVTILPPLILLLYPLSLQLLSICGLSEHRVVNTILKFTGIYKIIPFIDSFQSCYKDRLRFFAGLYFIYRIAALLVFAFNDTSYNFNTTSVVLLVLLLGIHSIVQPYKQRLHNKIESLVLFNLILIKCCDVRLKEDLYNKEKVDSYFLIISAFQLVLLYLPMLVILFTIGRFCLVYFKCKYYKRNTEDQQTDNILEYVTERTSTKDQQRKGWGYGSLRN